MILIQHFKFLIYWLKFLNLMDSILRDFEEIIHNKTIYNKLNSLLKRFIIY